jgi:hypothetical protein
LIRSRVFLFVIGVFFLGILLTYTFVDFRDTEDKAYDDYQNGQYEKVLTLYSNDVKPNSEFELTILSQTYSQLEKKLNHPTKGKETSKFLKSKKAKIVEWETSRGIYYHLEDPYFPMIRRHGDAYKRALITKINSITKPIPKNEVTNYLLLLILEDPRGMEESFSEALANLLGFSFESIGEIEKDFLSQTLHFLSESSSSKFYHQIFKVKGSNVNLRSGPGVENPELGKVSEPEIGFCFEEDSNRETIANMTGVWKKCYYPNLQKSAWIFSGFLAPEKVDETRIQTFQKRFKAIENEVRIDFEGWDGTKIPQTFFGTYIPREPEVEAGETGFPLFASDPKQKEKQRICKKVAGDKNYFEFSFHPTESKDPISFLEIHLVYAGQSHTAYSIEADRESIWVNKNRYLLDGGAIRENLSLHIESRTGDRITASLWRRNTGLLQAIKSDPLDLAVLQSGRFSWEICLPLSVKPSREKILLFDIRTGVH